MDKIGEVSTSVATTNTRLDATNTRLDIFGTRIREVQGEVKVLKGEVNDLKGEVKEVKNELKQLSTKIDMIMEHLGVRAEPVPAVPALPNLRPQASSPSTSRFTNITTSSHLTVNTQVPAAPSSHSPSGSLWSRFSPSASTSVPADSTSVAGPSSHRRLFKSKSFTGGIFGTGSKKGKESRKDA